MTGPFDFTIEDGNRTDRRSEIDALRAITVVCVILYHCLSFSIVNTNSLSKPVVFLIGGTSWVLSVFQNEVLIFLAIFLLLSRSDPLGAARWVKRLAELYLIWTAIYLITDPLLGLPTQIDSSNAFASLAYVLLTGGAKYHLHFFSALFVAVFLIRKVKATIPTDIIVCSIVATSIARYALETNIDDNATVGATTLIYLHVLAIINYLPFAFLAGALASASEEGEPIKRFRVQIRAAVIIFGIAAAACFLANWAFAATAAALASRSALIAWLLLASVATPPAAWVSSAAIRRLAERSYGMFMMHPLFIDLLLVVALPVYSPLPRLILLFTLVVTATYLLVGVVRRFSSLSLIS